MVYRLLQQFLLQDQLTHEKRQPICLMGCRSYILLKYLYPIPIYKKTFLRKEMKIHEHQVKVQNGQVLVLPLTILKAC
ncbi:MAG: hypothetical protein AUJ21_00925 [Anaerolineae bacterium CG1_02_58_13]|nr:MAG: hypothetical protein AUJ21_00925 [Anaerolineae bacterium CG1_02_58_13]